MQLGFRRNFKTLDVLAYQQLQEIHYAALELLEETGVSFESDVALQFLKDNGCEVNLEETRVRFPSGLVEECLHKVPSTFLIKARDPKDTVRIGGNRFHIMSWCGMDKADPGTGARIRPTVQDAIEMTKLNDALENIHVQLYGPYMNLKDVPAVLQLITGCALRTRYSTKPIFSGTIMETEIWNIKMALATNQQFYVCAMDSPPLTWSEDATRAAFSVAEAGFPLGIVGTPAWGGTGPVTIAGSLVGAIASVLALMVLAQLAKPGTPCLASPYSFPMDLVKSGVPLFGSLDHALLTAMFNQYFRQFGIPTESAYISAAKTPDYQCGYEKAMGLLLGALSGVNLLSIAGAVYDEITIDPVVSVIDNDMIGSVAHVLEGWEITDETIAVDLQKQVGPIPGTFLSQEHTRKWARKGSVFMPKVVDNLALPDFLKRGGPTIYENARQRMEEILATHEPIPLPEDQDSAIDEILEEATKYYKEKGMITEEEEVAYRKVLESARYC